MNAVRLLLLSVLCLGAPRVTVAQAAQAARCELPQPRVLRTEANAIVQVWDLPADPIWTSETSPDVPGYAAYRTRIRAVGGDQPKPLADPPTIRDDNERELWRKEDLNADRMYNGVGKVRPVQCIDAALFALQDSRYSQLMHPTEFVAHILRNDGRLKIYFGASDGPTLPKSVYGLDEVAAAVAEGWEYWVVLHNHTIRSRDGRPALGVPAPSTSDVDFFRNLVMTLGLREIWVTNGLYTGVALASDLDQFYGR